MKLTKNTRGILIINILMFILTNLSDDIKFKLILFPFKSEYFTFYQLFTYMFLHASFLHIFFNMLGLLIFGLELEKMYGSRKFLQIYLLSGIGSALFHLMFMDSPVLGASGAVWSLMVIYALANPNQIFYVYFIIPAKIKYIIGIYFVIELFLFFIGAKDGISHAAHIGGAISGLIAYKFCKINFI